MPTNLRIVFVAPFGLGQKTTVWARTLPLAQELSGKGHRVMILIPPWDTPSDADHRRQIDGVWIEQVSLAGGLPAILMRLLRRLRSAHPDIVHVIKPRAYAGLVQEWLWLRAQFRDADYKILLDVDDWEQAWASINGYSWPVARFLAWQEEWGIRHAHGITAASRWLMNKVETVAPHIPALYLPNGIAGPYPEAYIDTSLLPNDKIQPEFQDILFFTRFVEVDPQWLAEFWSTLHANLPNTRLTIAGKGFRPEHELAFRLHLNAPKPGHARAEIASENNGILWLGYVPPDQLEQLYAHVDCAIFPAQNIPLHQAKCSVRLATTLLRGIPVVASAVGEQIAYGAEGAAYLVAPDATPPQFAQAVSHVLQDPGRQRNLTSAARQRLLKKYDWAHLSDALEEFYLRLGGNL